MYEEELPAIPEPDRDQLPGDQLILEIGDKTGDPYAGRDGVVQEDGSAVMD